MLATAAAAASCAPLQLAVARPAWRASAARPARGADQLWRHLPRNRRRVLRGRRRVPAFGHDGVLGNYDCLQRARGGWDDRDLQRDRRRLRRPVGRGLLPHRRRVLHHRAAQPEQQLPGVHGAVVDGAGTDELEQRSERDRVSRLDGRVRRAGDLQRQRGGVPGGRVPCRRRRCRASTSIAACDPAESCTGSSALCPPNVITRVPTAETCNGVDDNCSGVADEPFSVRPVSCSTVNRGSPSGVYEIDPDGAGAIAPFAAYCDMTTNGGGWTLALKADGRAATFIYDAAYWTNTVLLNPGSTNNEFREAKLASFTGTSFNELMAGFSANGYHRNIVLSVLPQSSLQTLFASGTVSVGPGRGVARCHPELFAPAQLQPPGHQHQPGPGRFAAGAGGHPGQQRERLRLGGLSPGHRWLRQQLRHAAEPVGGQHRPLRRLEWQRRRDDLRLPAGS
ncbi:MAG: hypothetical protein IPF99_31965 [Deltaproteobacteria bacterium]|nr:hypothetical protein [Deltaproteobacteria bacterium]